MHRISLVALAALSLVAIASPAVASEQRFSFRAAEFMDDEIAEAKARAFLAADEPVGLPIAEAARRLSSADMQCQPSLAEPGQTKCWFAMMAGGDGGTLGADIWTVRLAPDSQQRLAEAKLNHNRTGFAP